MRPSHPRTPALEPAHAVLSSPFGGGQPVDALAKAAQAAGRALELDATIAEAHLVLGEVALRRWQWTDAEARNRRALDLDPNNAAAHAGRARWLFSQGRTDEALEWAQRARELDPLALYGRDIGWIFSYRAAMRTPFASSTRYSPYSQTNREPCGSSALR